MNEFEIYCPHCSQKLRMKEEWREMDLECPYCKKIFSLKTALPTSQTVVEPPVQNICITSPSYNQNITSPSQITPSQTVENEDEKNAYKNTCQSARNYLLATILFSFVNCILASFKIDFFFSFGIGFTTFAHTGTWGIIFSIGAILLYFFLWLFSAYKKGCLLTAFILYLLDSIIFTIILILGMIELKNYSFVTKIILFIAIHTYILVIMGKAFTAKKGEPTVN